MSWILPGIILSICQCDPKGNSDFNFKRNGVQKVYFLLIVKLKHSIINALCAPDR